MTAGVDFMLIPFSKKHWLLELTSTLFCKCPLTHVISFPITDTVKFSNSGKAGQGLMAK